MIDEFGILKSPAVTVDLRFGVVIRISVQPDADEFEHCRQVFRRAPALRKRPLTPAGWEDCRGLPIPREGNAPGLMRPRKKIECDHEFSRIRIRCDTHDRIFDLGR